jgi:ketosteroid isomerase-like protein
MSRANLTTREVIDGIFAAAATGDLEAVMGWWAAGGVLEDITIARAFRGHDEIRGYLDMYYRALPDVTYTPIRLVIDGPSAVVEWAQPAVIAAAFDGTPSTGRKVFLRAVDIFHIADGLVQHESSWYGDGWLRQRLGDSAGDIPSALPVTPALRASGWRF